MKLDGNRLEKKERLLFDENRNVWRLTHLTSSCEKFGLKEQKFRRGRRFGGGGSQSGNIVILYNRNGVQGTFLNLHISESLQEHRFW